MFMWPSHRVKACLREVGKLWMFLVYIVYINIIIYIKCTHTHMHDTCTHHTVSRGQRTTLGNWFSPFTVWALEIQEGSEVRGGGQAWQQTPLPAEPPCWPCLDSSHRKKGSANAVLLSHGSCTSRVGTHSLEVGQSPSDFEVTKLLGNDSAATGRSLKS